MFFLTKYTTHHHSLVDLEGIPEHVLSDGRALYLPQLGRLPLQVLLVVAHLRDGQRVGAVLVLDHPVGLQQVVAHPRHLLHEAMPGYVERVLEADRLTFLLERRHEQIRLFEDGIPLGVELVRQERVADEVLLERHFGIKGYLLGHGVVVFEGVQLKKINMCDC